MDTFPVQEDVVPGTPAAGTRDTDRTGGAEEVRIQMAILRKLTCSSIYLVSV